MSTPRFWLAKEEHFKFLEQLVHSAREIRLLKGYDNWAAGLAIAEIVESLCSVRLSWLFGTLINVWRESIISFKWRPVQMESTNSMPRMCSSHCQLNWATMESNESLKLKLMRRNKPRSKHSFFNHLLNQRNNLARASGPWTVTHTKENTRRIWSQR